MTASDHPDPTLQERMSQSLSSRTVTFSDVDPETLEMFAEQIAWVVRPSAARLLLLDPLLGVAQQVFVLSSAVGHGFAEEDPNSPMAEAVWGITDSLMRLIDAVEDAKEVVEFRGATSDVATFSMKGEGLPALQPLLILAKRLSWLVPQTASELLDDAIEDLEKVSAAFQPESEKQQEEES